MSRATLKRSLGEAGAFFDDSHGEDNLLAVLTSMANVGESLSVKEASPSTGIKASMVMDGASRIGTLYTKIGTTGTALQTDVRVRVNGTLITGTLSTLNTEADGTYKGLAYNYNLAAGDLVEIDFTAVATGAANVAATLRMKPVTVET
jgi:hypothetical protein